MVYHSSMGLAKDTWLYASWACSKNQKTKCLKQNCSESAPNSNVTHLIKEKCDKKPEHDQEEVNEEEDDSLQFDDAKDLDEPELAATEQPVHLNKGKDIVYSILW